MSNFKGTQERWQYNQGRKAIHTNNKYIATLAHNPSMEFYPTEEQLKANGQLMSKAPEMLDMLESIVETWDTNENFDAEYFNNIRKLIREATRI